MRSVAGVVLALLAAAAAPAGSAADPCPNEALRTGLSAGLPACRAYELVSPVDINDQSVLPLTPELLSGVSVSTSGQRVAFRATGPFGDAQSGGLSTMNLASRDGSGWLTHSIAPPIEPVSSGVKAFENIPSVSGMPKADLSSFAVVASNPPLSATAPTLHEGQSNLYMLDNTNGAWRIVTGVAPPAPPTQAEEEATLKEGATVHPKYDGASADSNLVLFSEPYAFTPEAPIKERKGAATNLYLSDVSDAGKPYLVGVLPNGEVNPGGAEVRSGGKEVKVVTSRSLNAISADGSRVFFRALGKNPLYGAGQLFVREDPTSASASTVQLSAYRRGDCADFATCTAEAGPDPSGAAIEPSFAGASADGTSAFFTSGQKLTDDATTGPADKGRDLYRYDFENGELEDLTPDSNPADENGADVQLVMVSNDGSYVYFVAKGALGTPPNQRGDSPIGGLPNLFVWHGGELRFIGTAASGDLSAGSLERSTSVTPDGHLLVFAASTSLTGYDNTDAKTGEPDREVYSYDAVGDALACVSCDPSGAKPTGPAFLPSTNFNIEGQGAPSRIATDNGGAVFFSSPDALIPSLDSNGLSDVYQYEGGQLQLISTGRGEYDSVLAGVSADGADVFFTTRGRLVGVDVDNSGALYDARVDGGIATQNPAPPLAPCEAASCRGPLSSGLPLPGAGSASFSGSGNRHRSRCHRSGSRHRRSARSRSRRCTAGRHRGPAASRASSRVPAAPTAAEAPGAGRPLGVAAPATTGSGGGAATPAASGTPGSPRSAAAAFDFGFLPGAEGFDGSISDEAGEAATQAGSHPFKATTSFALKTTASADGRTIPAGDIKDLRVELPPGFVGDPHATPQCTELQLIGSSAGSSGPGACPDGSQVGVADVVESIVNPFGGIGAPQTLTFHLPIYNLIPPFGAPAQLGFNLLGVPTHINVSVRSGTDYGVVASVDDINETLPILSSKVTLWGVPDASSHDSERGDIELETCKDGGSQPCPAHAPAKPFLTLPMNCSAGPLTTTIGADPWQDPGNFRSASFLSHDNASPPQPVGATACEVPDFSPTISLQPDASAADTPSGLHVDLHLPQSASVGGIAEAELKTAVVKLPPGLTVSPSSANGLGSCSPAQIGLLGSGFPEPSPIHFTADPAVCPDSSKIGRVEVDTPLLDHPLKGAVYLAAQEANPFGSLLAIYIAVDDPETGIVAKLAGHVVPDPQTGQLTTTFDNNPQIPFEDFKLDFFGGPQAPLRTPPTCGQFASTTEMTPWTAPARAPATPSSSFAVGAGANGSPCASSEAAQPNQPTFEAGTVAPIAGAYSPFVLHLRRPDGSQQLSSLRLTLPPGLSAKLAGIPYCPDGAIQRAESRSQPGDGALEQADPSCPGASRVGTVDAGAGPGPSPIHVRGDAYLAGPYKGAPLSLAIVTPALAGPFDLGTVVVRSALYVDPETARVTAQSDPLPAILHGVPLDLTSIAIDMDRRDFTLNPTSCERMSLNGEALSTVGQPASLANPFQVGACNARGFAPQLALRLFGATHRGAHPGLRAVLKMPRGNANIASAVVALPHSAFLDQAHIKTICTRVQFAQGACPADAIYGHAVAITPLLDQPLEGPVYLRSSSHQLPDLVADLRGQIQIVLDGRIDSVHGGIRSSFEAVPDAPVTKFVLTMEGGSKGLLVNSTNICSSRERATVRFDAQNGKTHDIRPLLKNGCGGH